MGAWGIDVFENDCALDWVYELSESSGLSALQQALSAVVDSDDYLEVDEGSAGLAAIEVINLLRGVGPDSVPKPVTDWVDANAGLDVSSIIGEANRALAAIGNTDTSEVAQLWLEGSNDWSGMLSNLRARLNA